MHSLPYPLQRSKRSLLLLILGWLFGALVAPYILVFPPVSYEGFGLVASVGWGVMFGGGAILMLVGQLLRSYLPEAVGVMFTTSGILVYALLSWEQAITTSPGSGTRALLVSMLFCWLLHRGDQLYEHHKTLKRIDAIGRG